jgi:hypothetical protein
LENWTDFFVGGWGAEVEVEVSAAGSGHAVCAMADLSGRRRLLLHVSVLGLPLRLLVLVLVDTAGVGAGVGAGVSLADSPACRILIMGDSSSLGTSSSGGAAADDGADFGVPSAEEDRMENSSTTVLGTVLAVETRSSSAAAASSCFGDDGGEDLAARSRSIRRWADVLSSRGSVAESSAAVSSGRLPPPDEFLPPELVSFRRVASAVRVRISPGMREWTAVLRWAWKWVVGDGLLATMLRCYSLGLAGIGFFLCVMLVIVRLCVMLVIVRLTGGCNGNCSA